jgi:hypothetical protein
MRHDIGAPRAGRLVVVDAVRSLAQRLCRKSLCFALRRPGEERDKLINDGAPRTKHDFPGADQAFGRLHAAASA